MLVLVSLCIFVWLCRGGCVLVRFCVHVHACVRVIVWVYIIVCVLYGW